MTHFLHSLELCESPLAMTLEPNRRHKHRRNQTKAYHARIQKKWNKRFGKHEAPGIWRAMGVTYVHPTIMQKLRQMPLVPVKTWTVETE